MICYVTRYNPKSYPPIGEAVPIEAETQAEAAEQVCGFKVEAAPPASATVSVSCIGDKPNERQYSEGQFELRSC